MGFIKYIKASFKEVKEKVTWPSNKRVQNNVIVVALFSVVFSLLISGVDFLIKSVLQRFFESF